MPSATLFLDLVFIGSCNDIHLAAFREIPDFQCFKGRIELVRVPFILDVRHEEQLYRERLREAAGGRHIAPHTAYVAALWAVLSRMRKPQIERFPSTLAEVIGKLSPLDKVELYATRQVPEDLSPDRARELAAHIKDLFHESDTYPIYEGRVGASPREMQTVLLAAAGSTRLRLRLAARRARRDRRAVQADLEPLRVPAPGRPAGRLSTITRSSSTSCAGGCSTHRRRGARRGRARRGVASTTRVFERYVTHVMHCDQEGEGPQPGHRPAWRIPTRT